MNLARLLHGPKSLVLLVAPAGLKSNTTVVMLRRLGPSTTSCTFFLICCTASLVIGLGTETNRPSLGAVSWASAGPAQSEKNRAIAPSKRLPTPLPIQAGMQ